jgi:hypothetical protein
MTDTSSAITPQALNRLEGQAAAQASSNARQLALTPYEYGLDPGGINPATAGPTAQESHPSAQRMASGQWDGKTSQLNHAQAAQPGSQVWVTVPVDKVTTTAPGISSATPVYASTKGYVPRPGESRGSIPPPIPTGHPY